MSATPAHDADLLWAILESLPHAVIAVERNGNVRVLNAAAKRMLGLDAEPLTHGVLNRMFRLLDGRTHQPIAQPFDHLLRTGSRGHRGIYDLLVRADGSKLPIEHSLSAFGNGAGVLVVLRDASRARDMMRRLNIRANHDGLTGLLNRAEFERRLARALARTTPDQRHALLYLDLDGFKRVNDDCGHAVGDAVLRQVARLLRRHLRAGDTLARLGGDEFALLVEGCPPDTARLLARTLGWAIEAHEYHIAGHRFRLRASIGIATLDDSHRDVHQALADADRACYANKRAAKARGALHPPGTLSASHALSC